MPRYNHLIDSLNYDKLIEIIKNMVMIEYLRSFQLLLIDII